MRRLIEHKNTTFEHKKTMKSSIEKGEYAFEYTTQPGKSYVIEPHGGGINYAMAKKDPNKFYEQVFNQDLTKHTVGKDKAALKRREEEQKQRAAEGKQPLKKARVATTVTTKVTKRPHLKILEKLSQKIAQKLQEKLGAQLGMPNILAAMKDKSVENQIKELVEQGKLQIVDQQDNIVFDAELREGMGVKRQNSQQLPRQQTPSAQSDDAPFIEIADVDAEG